MIANPIIQINDLVKNYYGKKAVNRISLEIPKTCFALLGPNGAGKTTTVLMVLGLIRPTSGEVFLFGKKVSTRRSGINPNIGYLPENVGFYPNLTGLDHLEFYARLRSNFSEDTQDPSHFLEWCGIEKSYWNKKVKTYSRGMKQRLGLAQAFIGNPKIVFLDEPLSNIDPLGREDLVRKIKQKQKEGINLVITSHIIQEVEQLAEYIAIIDNGNILTQGALLNLVIEHGLSEFEIKHENKLIKDYAQFELLKAQLKEFQDSLLENPVYLTDRIIVRTKSIKQLASAIKNFDKCYLKPLEGSLMKIYKKVVKGE